MKVEFYPSSKDVELLVPPPKPSAFYMPEWYKNSPKFSESQVSAQNFDTVGPNLKSCVPYLDAMINGYVQETWQDIIIEHSKETDQVFIRYLSKPDIVSTRDRIHMSFNSNEFYNVEFVWLMPWIPKLPNGWSMLYLAPLNHTEIPFYSPAGLVDSDKFYHSTFGNYPFYVKRGFSGIIPAGTPIAQMIPVYRENWKSTTVAWDEDGQRQRSFSLRKHIMESYKKMFHVKKSFS
jgi:hypothetical protein